VGQQDARRKNLLDGRLESLIVLGQRLTSLRCLWATLVDESMKAACFTKVVGVYGAAHQDAQRKNLLDGRLESLIVLGQRLTSLRW
jgi:hypothetical protein